MERQTVLCAGRGAKKMKRGWRVAAALVLAFLLLLNSGCASDPMWSEGASTDGSTNVSQPPEPTVSEPDGGSTSVSQPSEPTVSGPDGGSTSVSQPPEPAVSEPDGGSTDVSQPSEPSVPARTRAEELIPYFSLRYYLGQLDEDLLHVVCDLYEAVMNFEETVKFTAPISKTDYILLWELLRVECPELIQLDYGVSSKVTVNGAGNCVRHWIPYRFTEGAYWELRNACEAVIAEFSAATAGKSDYEKEKYVFDQIVSRNYYDKEAPYAGDAYGALVDGFAKCDGFSLAMKWAMESMGIQCLCIAGAPTTEEEGAAGHAWNVIRLDGTYYRLDLTDSVPVYGENTYGFEDIRYFAFNISDAMAAAADERYAVYDWLTAFAPVPACDRSDQCYYALNGGLIPANADAAALFAKRAEELLPDGGSFYVQFESREDYERFKEKEMYKTSMNDILGGQQRRWRYRVMWHKQYNGLSVHVWFE